MLKKLRYTLNEVSNELGIDERTIIQNAEIGKVKIAIEYHDEIIATAIEESRNDNIIYENYYENEDIRNDIKKTTEDCIFEGYITLSYITVVEIISKGKKSIPYYENIVMGNNGWLPSQLTTDAFRIIGKQNKYRFYLVARDKKREITKDDFIISNKELTRLLAIKDEVDNKPTLEQSQKENEALKQQLIESQSEIENLNKQLKAEHDNQPTIEQLQAQIEELQQQLAESQASQNKQQKRETILKAWVAGKGKDVAEKMVKTDIHDELKKIEPHLFGISYATFETFWKDQKILTLRAGSR